jgi:hypothetical protein
MTHPVPQQLALFAGGDLTTWSNWRVARHLHQCQDCSSEVAAYRGAAQDLKQLRELPADFDWGSLAMEMKANIRLGLAAGECVEQARVSRGIPGWRVIAVMASVLLVVMSGWLLHIPQPRAEQAKVAAPLPAISEPGVILQATSTGIQVQENGQSLTMLHRANEPATVSINTSGSVRARYVDSDTGQVTITNVYTE